MTAEQDTESSAKAAVVVGRPWLPGQSGNPNGRSKKGNAISDILRNRPLADKRALVDVAYREALKGNVQWAEWIVRHGEDRNDSRGGLVRELILREYGFDANLLD